MKSSVFAIIIVQILAAFVCSGSIKAQNINDALPPKVSLTEAVKLAEDYISKQELGHRTYFICSARYRYASPGGDTWAFGTAPYWEVTCRVVPTTPSGISAYFVSMKKEVKFLAGD